MTNQPCTMLRSIGKLLNRSALVSSLLIAVPLRADDSTVLHELRDALASKPTVWGEANIGRATRIDPDPAGAAAARKVADLIRQRTQRPPPPPGPAAKLPATQLNAIQRLRTQSGPNTDILLRPANGTIMQIRGGMLEPAVTGLTQASGPGASERTARNFLRRNQPLLRLDDSDAELKVESFDKDDTGGAHLRFSQWFRGLPVWPSGLSVHLDPRGSVESVDGAYIPTPASVDLVPVLNLQQAVAHAKGISGAWENGEAKAASLIIYAPLDQAPRLAWKFNYSVDFMHAWTFVVDAIEGRILNRVSQTTDVNFVGSAKDLAGQSRAINLWSATGKYYMVDTTKQSFNNAFDPIADPHGAISIFDARLAKENELKTVYLIESATPGDWLPEAVSALYNFGHTYDYYLERHARNSLDGSGANIQAVVRVSQMDNAFWSGDLKMMFFGDVRPYPLSLDVVGHELTHGVTQNSADLIYELQSGALNEAFSDIFAEMVEARMTGVPDWQIGTGLGKIFRNLKNPAALQIGGLNRPYPTKMSEYVDLPNSGDSDHGGVHINSTIIGHAFYLLAEGLDGGIGQRDAAQIFYRCLTQRLQRQSQFIDTRLGCIAAAEALFGVNSTQARKTAEAFDAVEILATPPTPEPIPIPPVQGADSTLLIAFDPIFGGTALGRRETAFNDPLDGIALVDSVKEARPAISGDGRLAVFADGASDVCLVNTDDVNTLACVGAAGTVHSVAMSPDASLVAIVLQDPVTGLADNKISILNINQGTTRTYDLLAPVLDGNPVDTVLFADSMVFTPDGKQLIYDAVSELHFGGIPVQRWSIFRINLPTDATTVLVPPVQGVNFGNPNISRTSNRYLTFDAQEVDTGVTHIMCMDLFTGDAGVVGTVGQGRGVPCFNGDDTAVIFAAPDASGTFTGYSLFRQALAPNRLQPEGQRTLWLPDATIGVIYRRGSYTNSNAVPTAQITSPINHGTYPAPANLTLTAKASDADGTVARVEFYNGGNKLGESAGPIYSFAWTNLPAGTYRLFARAIDNLGAIGDSNPITITVGTTNTPVFNLRAVAQRPGVIRLILNATAGNYIIQQSEDLKTWVDIYPISVDASGTGSLDDAGGPRNFKNLFYRAKKE